MTLETRQEMREAVTQLRGAVSFVSAAAKLAHVSDYLLQAEIEERDPWFAQDYRVASVMVGYAEEGKLPSYERAFLELFGKRPDQVTGWWRDRAKLWFLAQDGNRPSPLLLANRADELLLNRDLVEIPDHGFVPEGTLPWLRSVPYVGEYHPSEEHATPPPEPTARPKGVCIECASRLAPGRRYIAITTTGRTARHGSAAISARSHKASA